MKISYATTVHNEIDELKLLINQLDSNIDEGDEIVIVKDEGNTSKEIDEYLTTLEQSSHIYIHEHSLKGDFAAHKNFMNSKCTGDWIFNIDADEHFNDLTMLLSLREIIQMNPTIDAYWIPRINTVDGLKFEHLQRWNWRVTDDGWINWPDYQLRLYKNIDSIKWKNKVHETLDGIDTISNFPVDPIFALKHPKDIERQIRQNEMYENIANGE